MAKRIVVFGSTGSIGLSTLAVCRQFPERFKVSGLTANSDIRTLERQVRFFRPSFVAVRDEAAGCALSHRLRGLPVKVLVGEEGLLEAASHPDTDVSVMAITGYAALAPLLKLIRRSSTIALANKEALVAAGSLIMEKARRNACRIIPVDSEQSAIWQCLEGEDRRKLSRIYLTASGGPFHNASKKSIMSATKRQVLRHPRWKMGDKITVDSANLMNKGLELLETCSLFGVGWRDVEVLVHPQAVIHSMVEFVDGVVIAQLSVTDMRVPIQYALSYPERLPSHLACLDFCKIGTFNFVRPDLKKFPCLGLAYRVAEEGGTAPCVLNAANEVCVHKFLSGGLRFSSIPLVIEKVLGRHTLKSSPRLGDILAADAWARLEAGKVIEGGRVK